MVPWFVLGLEEILVLPTKLAMILVCEHENMSMWTLSICINRYTTTIESTYYNVNTYNIDIYNIITL